MTSNIKKDPLLIAFAVLNDDMGQGFINEGIKQGLQGGLITPATGLIGSDILNLLSIRHRKRDVAIFFEKESILRPAVKSLVKKYNMNRPNHGIIFILEINFSMNREYALEDNHWNSVSNTHQLLFMTYKHGRNKEILDSFKTLGYTGGTFFTSKGDFVNERQKILGLNVSPQKDVMLSVVETDRLPNIYSGFEDHFHVTNTKGMKLLSMDVNSFSESVSPKTVNNTSELSMLISIVSNDLEEEYSHIMKKFNMNGGTSIRGFGSISPEKIEKIFNINVTPQKNILFTVDKTEKINQAYLNILENDKLMSEHVGVYFTLPLVEAYGLYNQD